MNAPAQVPESEFLASRAERIRTVARRMAVGIVEIGTLLLEAKERLGHGKFLPWIETQFGWSRFTADRFMNVAQRFEGSNLQHLEIDVSALYLLARPSTPESVRTEMMRRAEAGEHITHAEAEKFVQAQRESSGPREVTLSLAHEAHELTLTAARAPSSMTSTPIRHEQLRLNRTALPPEPDKTIDPHILTAEEPLESPSGLTAVADPLLEMLETIPGYSPAEVAALIRRYSYTDQFPAAALDDAARWLVELRRLLWPE